MKQLVLEKIIVSGFPPVNKRCLWLKGNTFYFWYKGAWRSVESNVEIDNLENVVEQEVSDQIKTVMGNASENYDTLGEIENYIIQHESESSERDEKIEDLEKKIEEGGGSGNVGWTDVE